MLKFTVNHVEILTEGKYGPWGKALISAPLKMADGSKPDVIEMRSSGEGLSLETFVRLAKALPVVKKADQVLTCTAQVRTEERVERYVPKGETAEVSKSIIRLYLESTPAWSREAKVTVGEGNLADILGDLGDDSDSF